MGKYQDRWVQGKLEWRCEQCGCKLKDPKRIDKRFCSSVCRVKHWRSERAS